MRYRFIQDHAGQFSVQMLCRAMELKSGSYYAWRSQKRSARRLEEQAQEQALVVQIQKEHGQSRDTYGSPRIYLELREQGVACGRHRVARLMHSHQIVGKKRRRFQVTTQSDHALPVASNVLDRQFTVSAPHQRWVGDITYLWTREGWLYLAVVLDLFSRRVVGWSMQATMEAGLVCDALEMAIQRCCPPEGLLYHSDRGGQYASLIYQDKLRRHGMVASMSRKGNCWDNAVAESFFSTLKMELLPEQVFRTRAEAKASVFEYIEVWYNRKRRHSTLGYISPAQFEQRHFEQQQQLARAA
ncbi:transposase [Capsulimonas corticalis]|uniref:Transposase n=1 Tax=Capsulimonas corticalis TaxID=2219043 RepID=A0A9N7QCP3_9BACT|nr:transposase [Capsulimonas corticalis]